MGKIVVTDLTRFNNRSIACLAGLDVVTGKCVRPLGGGQTYFQYDSLKKHNIQPGSILEGEFECMNASAPHTEDYSYEGKVSLVGTATSADFLQYLESDAVGTILNGFKAEPANRVFPIHQTPPVSIITLRLKQPSTQLQIVEDKFHDSKIKAHVIDDKGFKLSFTPITDLGFFDHAMALRKSDPGLKQLNQFIQKQEVVYLRVGLSRAYTKDPSRSGFWVQINGIYTFPSYRTDLRTYV